MAAMADPMMQKCVPKYSAEELVVLEKIGTSAAAMKCFLDQFNGACNSYVKAAMMSFAEQANAAAAAGK